MAAAAAAAAATRNTTPPVKYTVLGVAARYGTSLYSACSSAQLRAAPRATLLGLDAQTNAVRHVLELRAGNCCGASACRGRGPPLGILATGSLLDLYKIVLSSFLVRRSALEDPLCFSVFLSLLVQFTTYPLHSSPAAARLSSSHAASSVINTLLRYHRA